MPIVSVLLGVMGPVFLFIVLGYGAMKTGTVSDPQPFSRFALYYLLPGFSFLAMVKVKMSGVDFWLIFLFPWVLGAIQYGVGTLASRFGKFQNQLGGFLLSVLGINCGYYGLPLVDFAFGQQAVAQATLFYVGYFLFMQSVGVYTAARGGKNANGGDRSWKGSLRKTAKMPLIYVSLAGLAVNWCGFIIPDNVLKALDYMSKTTMVMMLGVLGMELAKKRETCPSSDRIPLAGAVIQRLLGGPAIALFLAWLIGLEGMARDVIVFISAMPTAIQAVVFANEFRSQPALVSRAIVLSTLGSVVTLTALLMFLPQLVLPKVSLIAWLH